MTDSDEELKNIAQFASDLAITLGLQPSEQPQANSDQVSLAFKNDDDAKVFGTDLKALGAVVNGSKVIIPMGIGDGPGLRTFYDKEKDKVYNVLPAIKFAHQLKDEVFKDIPFNIQLANGGKNVNLVFGDADKDKSNAKSVADALSQAIKKADVGLDPKDVLSVDDKGNVSVSVDALKKMAEKVAHPAQGPEAGDKAGAKSDAGGAGAAHAGPALHVIKGISGRDAKPSPRVILAHGIPENEGGGGYVAVFHGRAGVESVWHGAAPQVGPDGMTVVSGGYPDSVAALRTPVQGNEGPATHHLKKIQQGPKH